MHRVHQSMKQRSFNDQIIEYDDVHKRERRHVGEGGKILDPQRQRFLVKGGRGEAPAVQFDGAYPVEQGRRKEKP